MTRRVSVLLATLVTILSVPLAAGAESPPPRSNVAAAKTANTVAVDCDKGKTIAKALETAGDELVIEIHGACHEDLVIRRDNVALVGAGEDPTLVGSLFFEGASGVLLEGFTIRDSERWGVRSRGAQLVVRNLTVRDNAGGGITILDGSTAILEEVTADRNRDGITTWVSSAVELVGEVRVRENLRCGMIVSSGSGLEATGTGPLIGDRLVAEDNAFCGLAVQIAAGAQFGEVIARRNGLVGVALFGGGSLGGRIEASDSEIGVWLSETSTVEGTVTAHDNSFAGVLAEIGSTLVLLPEPGPAGSSVTDNGAFGLRLDESHGNLDLVDVRRNGTGLSLDGSSSRIRRTTLLDNGLDADVTFGSRASFDGGNQAGTVACDSTVLTRGDVSCPSGAASAIRQGGGASSAAISAARPELPAFPLEMEDP
jgi:hypothetical protein